MIKGVCKRAKLCYIGEKREKKCNFESMRRHIVLKTGLYGVFSA